MNATFKQVAEIVRDAIGNLDDDFEFEDAVDVLFDAAIEVDDLADEEDGVLGEVVMRRMAVTVECLPVPLDPYPPDDVDEDRWWEEDYEEELEMWRDKVRELLRKAADDIEAAF